MISSRLEPFIYLCVTSDIPSPHDPSAHYRCLSAKEIAAPHFKNKLPNKNELKEMIVRMGKINTSRGTTDDVLREMADEYMKTPFFYTKK